MNKEELAKYMNSECFPYREALKTLTLGITTRNAENNDKQINVEIDDNLTLSLTMLALLDPLNIQLLINVLSFFQKKYIGNIWTEQKISVHEGKKETLTYEILNNSEIWTVLKQMVKGSSNNDT